MPLGNRKRVKESLLYSNTLTTLTALLCSFTTFKTAINQLFLDISKFLLCHQFVSGLKHIKGFSFFLTAHLKSVAFENKQ